MPNQICHQNKILDPNFFSNANRLEIALFQFYLALKIKLSLACQRARQRKALANLDDRLLRDVGISRQQVNIEIAKPFWCK